MNNNNLAPHSLEAEKAVLAAILLDPTSLDEILQIIKPTDFYYLKHQWIFEIMQRLGRDCDNITLQQALEAKGKLEDIGGVSYIMELSVEMVNIFYAVSYAKIIKETSIRRALIGNASNTAKIAADGQLEIADILTEAEKGLFAITSQERPKRGQWLQTWAQSVFDGVVDRLENDTPLSGVPTGFNELDDVLNGLQKSDLLIVAGRPAMGKSSLALNIGTNAARAGVGVAYFSLEMGGDQITQRLLAMETGINVSTIRTGRLTEDESRLFVEATGRVSDWPLFIDDDANWNIVALRSECRRLVMNEGVGLIIIDYIGLLDGTQSNKRGNENRVQEVSFITSQLKKMARELNVPVMALSQLSRGVEQRADKRPMLSDLRESGSIEQDADIVLFVYRDAVYNESTDKPNTAEIIIAKHRNGATGTIELHFNRMLTKFGNLRHEYISTRKEA